MNVRIVDGMFLLQSLADLPLTFGGVANVILYSLVRLSNRVDLVCDTSIKDTAREDRGAVKGGKVSEPEQRRPKDVTNALTSESFQISLLRFLLEELCRNKYAAVLITCELYFRSDEVCYNYKAEDDQIKREEITELNCQHEKADTRIYAY